MKLRLTQPSLAGTGAELGNIVMKTYIEISKISVLFNPKLCLGNIINLLKVGHIYVITVITYVKDIIRLELFMFYNWMNSPKLVFPTNVSRIFK